MELLQSQEYKNIKTTTAAENKIYLYLFYKKKFGHNRVTSSDRE